MGCAGGRAISGQASQLFPEPSGNVRDRTSQENYPLFKAERAASSCRPNAKMTPGS